MNDPLCVLVVDDAEEDLELIKTTLKAEGMAVVTASSSREARLRLRELLYDVVLVDLRLPDGDGLDLLGAARQADEHAVAIVLTGYASMDAAVASLRRGAYDFLTKPCPAEALAACVRRAAEKRRLARALARRTAEVDSLNRELDRRVQEATGRIGFLNDRLKRFIVELMEANQTRVRFMDNITHELKNPLMVICGYTAHFLGRPVEELSREDVLKYLKAVDRSGDALQGLLEELSEATRLSNHKLALRRERLDAGAEAAAIVDAFRLQAEGKGVWLFADRLEPALSLEADPRRLRQVLSNLVSNALKFTPPGGRICVSARPSGNSAHFCVEDTGPGIAPEDLSRVFDRFYQVESAHRHKGLGLGLEISRGLVTLHGGTIWAESEPGKGARFHFTIPCLAPAGSVESRRGG